MSAPVSNVATYRTAFASLGQGDAIDTVALLGSSVADRSRPLTFEIEYLRQGATDPNGVLIEMGSAVTGFIVSVNAGTMAIAAGDGSGAGGLFALVGSGRFDASNAGNLVRLVVAVAPLERGIRVWVDNEPTKMSVDLDGFALSRFVGRSLVPFPNGMADTEAGAVGEVGGVSASARMPAPQRMALTDASVGRVYVREGVPPEDY